MAKISAAKRRYREGRNGKIMDSKFFFCDRAASQGVVF